MSAMTGAVKVSFFFSLLLFYFRKRGRMGLSGTRVPRLNPRDLEFVQRRENP